MLAIEIIKQAEMKRCFHQIPLEKLKTRRKEDKEELFESFRRNFILLKSVVDLHSAEIMKALVE